MVPARGVLNLDRPPNLNASLPIFFLWAGDTLKLRETPKASSYQAGVERQPVARLIASGMVKTLGDVTMDNPHPSPYVFEYGEGSETKWVWVLA